MPTCSGIRTSLQPATDIVCYLLIAAGFTNIDSAELEMTVNMLIQIDKLVQLLESPVFTCELAHIL